MMYYIRDQYGNYHRVDQDSCQYFMYVSNNTNASTHGINEPEIRLDSDQVDVNDLTPEEFWEIFVG
jgi:hypothetical protein